MIGLCEHLIRLALPDRYIGNCWLDLPFLAGLYAALVVLFMRLTGLGRRLRATRQQMLAASYAMLLYHRIPSMVIRSEAQLIWHNLQYLFYLAPTIAFAGLIFAAALDPLHERYGCQPLKIGQEFLISLEGPGNLQVQDTDFAIDARVQVPKLNRVWAKLIPRHPGLLPLRVGSHVLAGNVDRPDVPRVGLRAWPDLTVRLSYPQSSYTWLGGFLGVCIVLAGLMMRLLGVQV